VSLYIEMLAHVLVDSDFLYQCQNPGAYTGTTLGSGGGSSVGGGSSSASKKEKQRFTLKASDYQCATRQVENLMCTTRESLLGSGAWNKEFYAVLQSRPFYSSTNVLTLCEITGGKKRIRKGTARG
jgi:hypothetical protein